MNLKQSIGVVTDRAPHPAEAGSILSNHPKIILADCSRCCQDLLKALLRVKEHWLNNVDRTHLVLLDSDIKELLLARDTVLFDSRRDDTKQNMFGTSSFFPEVQQEQWSIRIKSVTFLAETATDVTETRIRIPTITETGFFLSLSETNDLGPRWVFNDNDTTPKSRQPRFEDSFEKCRLVKPGSDFLKHFKGTVLLPRHSSKV